MVGNGREDMADGYFSGLVEKDNDVPSHNQISVRNLDSHDGVRKRDEYARGGADASEYRPQPAAVRNDARDTSALAGFVSRRVKPSSPSGWTRHEGTGVLLATRGRPCVWRWHRATSLNLRKSKPLATRRCVPPSYSLVYDFSCQLPKRPASLTKLFSLLPMQT